MKQCALVSILICVGAAVVDKHAHDHGHAEEKYEDQHMHKQQQRNTDASYYAGMHGENMGMTHSISMKRQMYKGTERQTIQGKSGMKVVHKTAYYGRVEVARRASHSPLSSTPAAGT